MSLQVGLLVIHIITHAAWIKQATTRFVGKLTNRLRFYYLLDAVLLVAVIVITLSGVLVSTWLVIDYSIYPLIRDIHIISSISGLALLIIKLALHWKFFVNAFRRIRVPKVGASTPAEGAPVRAYSRRGCYPDDRCDFNRWRLWIIQSSPRNDNPRGG